MSWSLSAFADEAAASCDDQIRALTDAEIAGVDLQICLKKNTLLMQKKIKSKCFE